MKTSSYSRGYLIAFTATVLWSSTGVIISYLSKTYSLPSLVLAFWRDLFVSFGMLVGLLLFSRSRFHLPRSQWGFMILYGLTLAIFNSMWTFSVQFNGAAVATVLAFSSPAMTAILSRIFYNEKIRWIKIVSILLSLGGMIFVSGAQNPATWKLNAAGIIFGLLTGLFFAVYNMGGKHASDEKIDSWTALLYSFASATFFLALFNLGMDLFSGRPVYGDMLWLGNSVNGWGLLFFLGVVPTLVGFGLYTMSMRFIPATSANLVATLEPVFTAIWAFLFLKELLKGDQFFGGLLVLIGVILLRMSEGEKTAEVLLEPSP